MPKGKRKGRPNEQNARNSVQPSNPMSAMPRSRETPINENVENIGLPSAFAEASNCLAICDVLNDEDIKIDHADRMLITTGLPPKQPPGRLGRRINLISNLFSISFLPEGNIYHYDVKIINITGDSTKPEDKKYNRYRCMNTRFNREIIDKILKTNPHFRNSFATYDGESNLYTPSPLNLEFPFESGKICIGNENKSALYKVIVKPVEKKNAHGMKVKDCAINLTVLHELFRGKMRDVDDIQEAMMALETVFRHSPALKYFPIGRNFYHPDIGGVNPLSGGIEIWFGYHQSLRLGQWSAMVNLNTSATTFFREQPLIEYISDSLNIRLNSLVSLDKNALKQLNSELKNVKIETYHQKSAPKMTHRIFKIVNVNAKELKFTKKSVETNIVDYFKNEYKIKLEYPHLPCVQVKPENKRIYFPLEVCHIPEGQHSRKELTDNNKREMIKFTADPPGKKFDKILNIRNEQADYDDDEYLKSFGVRVEKDPIRLAGRVLPSPNLQYRNQRVQPRNGSWNLVGLKFFGGSNINSWILLSLAHEDDCSYNNLRYFSKKLQEISGASDLYMDEPVAIKIIPNIKNIDVKVLLNKLYKELVNIKHNQIELTVVVIPFKSQILYRNVKQMAEVHLGLLTQCIDHNNVKKCNPSLLGNLCLKINAKMGGINHTLTQGEIPRVMGKPVLVIGADVSHAPVTDRSGISVAAVAGSLDMILSRFSVVCKLQKNPKASKKSVETILELKDMVKALLKSFYNHTRGKKPEKIIFFRDGVSDGQFQEVKEKEVVAVRHACIELQRDYQPEITFIVVQKRHQVRFRPEDFRDGVGKERNIPPGTVVDTDIVHPVHRDFYLCSHLGLKGTSRPAHYTVLEDDSEFSADDLQKLSYYLCNISFRCSKSISIPVPVAYADLAAYRTRLRLSILPEDQKEKQIDSSEILQETLDATQLVESIKNSMYFV